MDTVTKKKRSEIMSRIKSKSSIEVLPDHLRGQGMRRHPKIFGRPDFGSKKRAVAIFIDGCFWHSCPIHGKTPKTNKKFWLAKFERNRNRDELVNKTLLDMGYNVIRIWEHDLKHKKR